MITTARQVLLWKVYGKHTKRIIITLLIFHGRWLCNLFDFYMKYLITITKGL